MPLLSNAHLLILSSGHGMKMLPTRVAQQTVSHISLIVDTRGNHEFQKLSPQLIWCDTRSWAAVRNAAAQLHRQRPIDGVLTFDEGCVEYTARLNARFGTLGISPRTAERCRNKWLMRRAWQRAGLPIPQFWLATERHHLRHIARQCAFPVVCKPLCGVAGKYVTPIHNRDGLVTAWQIITGEGRALFDSIYPSTPFMKRYPQAMLLESYVSGREISVESVTNNFQTTVVAVHDKCEVREYPTVVETYGATPSTLSVPMQQQVHDLVFRALRALDFSHGVAHTEIRMSATGPILIETAARMGGAGIYSSVRHSTAVDLVQAACAVALGRDPHCSPQHQRRVGFRKIVGPPGKILDITGWENIKNDPHVLEASLYVRPGTELPALAGTQALGHILLTGDNHDQMRAYSRQLEASVCFRYAN